MTDHISTTDLDGQPRDHAVTSTWNVSLDPDPIRSLTPVLFQVRGHFPSPGVPISSKIKEDPMKAEFLATLAHSQHQLLRLRRCRNRRRACTIRPPQDTGRNGSATLSSDAPPAQAVAVGPQALTTPEHRVLH
jgi:hypothetical protein